jgi:putative MFS transporter
MTNSCVAVANHNYLSEIFPTKTRARWVGGIYSSTRIVAAFSCYLIAYFLSAGGAKDVFAFLTVIMLIAVSAVALLGPRTKNRTFENA